MERLGSRSPAPHTPAMIAHGALIFALLGRPGDTERWAAVAEGLPATGTLPDGSTVEATLAYLRANLCRERSGDDARDALEALAGLGPTSPYRATMLHTEGLSYLLEGDLDQADASFAHAYDLAASIETSPVAALVLAEQFQVAVERDEWTAAESLIKRALEIVARGPLDEYWTSALVFASAARAAAHRGDMPRRASMPGARRACARCSPMPCRSSRSRRWSSWPAPTWPWSTRPGRGPCWSRSAASSSSVPTSGPSRPPPTAWTSGSARSRLPRRSARRR